jgi:hypothetical protein
MAERLGGEVLIRASKNSGWVSRGSNFIRHSRRMRAAERWSDANQLARIDHRKPNPDAAYNRKRCIVWPDPPRARPG